MYYLLLFVLRSDERKGRQELSRIRSRRLNVLLRHLRKSPFYEEYDLNASLEQFPVINKEIFMRDFDKINTCGIKREEALDLALKAELSRDFSSTIHGIAVGLSTGTSGNKGIFLASESERAHWAAAVIHRVVGISLKPRKVAFFLRANSKLYESADSWLLQFNFFDLMDDHESNFQRLDMLKPDILVAQPSALIKIAASYREKGIVPEFTKVISVAEVLDPTDKLYLEKAFRLPLDEVYQCTEGFLACTCKYGKMHF
ncbi:MAG: adenylate synthase, partial [Bacteroidales bacterium]|nr:adenylate synthase [Bacteroidales bacterium]